MYQTPIEYYPNPPHLLHRSSFKICIINNTSNFMVLPAVRPMTEAYLTVYLRQGCQRQDRNKIYKANNNNTLFLFV